jgi:hypothetical protein
LAFQNGEELTAKGKDIAFLGPANSSRMRASYFLWQFSRKRRPGRFKGCNVQEADIVVFLRKNLAHYRYP